MYSYKTRGVCAREIKVELEGDVVKSVQFVGGCNGNTKGISALVEGMKVNDVIAKCENITCGTKASSCPAQLALALKEITE
ncbi:MAG: TIGR03905 family TSCPD domain-containing protein [Clostridia bacterium]